MSESEFVLEMRDVRKSYGITQALKGVSVALRSGRVYGLVGENGAGKSTLVKSMCGAVLPDSGEILINGATVTMRGPQDARDLGVSTVFQELSLIPDLSLAENIQLQRKDGWVSGRRKQLRYAEKLAAEWGIASIDASSRLDSLSLRDQQLAEILCAVNRPHQVLILDEPTSALLPADVDWLEGIITRVTASGGAVVIITHMLEEIERFCDEIYVQRNGLIVDSVERQAYDRTTVIEQMIGRSLESAYPERPAFDPSSSVVLRAESVGTKRQLRDLDLSIRAGEIVGVAGLDGQGQEEVFEVLAGVRRRSTGTIQLNGAPFRASSPAGALRPGKGAHGISFVPAERKTLGAILDMSIRKNIALSILRKVTTGFWINDAKEESRVRNLMRSVQVDETKIDDPVRSLSGGNQQKVVFAKALANDSDVLLLFDPTRGVDVGTKYEIYRLICGYAEQGKAVLMYSTEIPEIVNLCHRALVIYRGTVAAEFEGEDLQEHNLMSAAIGASR
jgi:ribose transport system ATP-binding protein